MAYDQLTAQRVRDVLTPEGSITERRMFGGLAFMMNGHMCCGVVGKDLVVRLGADAHERSLRLPHTRPMDFTGRPMKGFVYVQPAGYDTETSLKTWIEQGLSFVRKLPPK